MSEVCELCGGLTISTDGHPWCAHDEEAAALRQALADLTDAAEHMDRAGAHDGPCTNDDDPEDLCVLHMQAYQLRAGTLRDAAAAARRTLEGVTVEEGES